MAKTRAPAGEGPRAQRVQVRIGGEPFWLKGDAPAPYMERLAARVDSVLQSVLARDPSMPRYRAAILTAIHIAHELERKASPADEDDPAGGAEVAAGEEHA